MQSTPEQTRGRTMHVLLVDYSPLIRRAIMRGMGSGFQVTAVGSAAEARSLLSDDRSWDTILCNLNLPDAPDGALIQHIQRDHTRHARGLVILTGGAQTARSEELLAETSLPVLFKPVGLATLRTLVRRLSRGERRACPRRPGARLTARIGPIRPLVVDYSRTGLRLWAPADLHNRIQVQLSRGAATLRVEGHHVRDAAPHDRCYEMAGVTTPDALVLEEWLRQDARLREHAVVDSAHHDTHLRARDLPPRHR